MRLIVRKYGNYTTKKTIMGWTCAKKFKVRELTNSMAYETRRFKGHNNKKMNATFEGGRSEDIPTNKYENAVRKVINQARSGLGD